MIGSNEMLSSEMTVKNTLRKCDETLERNLKMIKGGCSSPKFSPKISLDKQVIETLHECNGQINKREPSCQISNVSPEVGETGRSVSFPTITPEIIGSVGAQFELLRHELFLTKKQVKERSRQIMKLERIINHQKVELKHNCEGSSNLMKMINLLSGAVDVQNKQLDNMRNIKERLVSLEGSPFIYHKPVGAEKNKEKYGSLLSTNLLGPGVQPVMHTCDHVCGFDSQTDVKTTKHPLNFSRPTMLSTGSQPTKADKTTNTDNTNSDVFRGFDPGHSRETQEELEKQKMINFQLNEHLMKLQKEVKDLKLKTEKLEESEVAALKSSSLFEKEKKSLIEQLTSLAKQNGKLQGHVSQIDRERDKAVRELDSSDERISKMGIEVQKANSEARKLECRLRTAAARCGRLEELLENSEKIAASLKKHKTHLEKVVDHARNEMEVLKKSFHVLRNKYKKACNSILVYKKKMWEANEEKTVLQSQIQEYVSRVRNIEDLLLHKEQEREFIFQQFQELTAKDNSRAEAEESCHNITRNFLQEMDHEITFWDKGHGPIQTEKDLMDVTSKNEQLTSQLDVMGKTVNNLESQVKMIGASLEHCRNKCISREEKNFRQCSAESSLSTML